MVAERIREQDLFREAHGKDQGPGRDIVVVDPVSVSACELRHHLPVMQHRTCDEMRKVGDEQQVMNEVRFFDLALPAVDQDCDLRERKERNPDRQVDGSRNWRFTDDTARFVLRGAGFLLSGPSDRDTQCTIYEASIKIDTLRRFFKGWTR